MGKWQIYRDTEQPQEKENNNIPYMDVWQIYRDTEQPQEKETSWNELKLQLEPVLAIEII